VIVMITLTLDMITQEDRNENRFYFLLETFNKLALHVASVQKYFNFKNFTPKVVFAKEVSVSNRFWQVINLKASIEHFALYTKLHFKQLQNLNSAPVVQYHMIKIWLVIFNKHREGLTTSNLQNQLTTASIADLLQMKAQEALLYSRNLILTLIQNAYFNICEVSQQCKDISQTTLKYSTYNFKQHFNCILDYVLPQ
jgi:hypothetical protein